MKNSYEKYYDKYKNFFIGDMKLYIIFYYCWCMKKHFLLFTEVS